MVMLVKRIIVGDMWAKRSIEDDQYDATVIQFPSSVLNFHFWKEFDNLWQITWSGSDKGRYTFEVKTNFL